MSVAIDREVFKKIARTYSKKYLYSAYNPPEYTLKENNLYALISLILKIKQYKKNCVKCNSENLFLEGLTRHKRPKFIIICNNCGRKHFV